MSDYCYRGPSLGFSGESVNVGSIVKEAHSINYIKAKGRHSTQDPLGFSHLLVFKDLICRK